MFSYKSFLVFGLIFKFLTHFEFIFVYDVSVLVAFFQMQLSSFSRTTYLRGCLFSFIYSFFHRYVGLSRDFCLVPLVYSSVFVLITNSPDDCRFVVQSEVRKLIPPSSICLIQDCFGYLGLLCFHTNCETFCFSSVKNIIGSLIGIILNLQITLGHIVIFTILILPIQGHGLSLHLFVWVLISFITVIQFSAYSSFVSLGRFMVSFLKFFLLQG